MQVLGDLIDIADHNNSLPLPWWHRAPLGLSTRTHVYVSLLKPKHRPVGDIVVSVLNPAHGQDRIAVDIRAKDEPGVLAKLVGNIYPLNIALAEAVTIGTSGEHTARLICEVMPNKEGVTQVTRQFRKDLERTLSKHCDSPRVTRFPAPPPALWSCMGEVKQGRVEQIPWQQAMKDHFAPKALNMIDLNMAVATADTERRHLRFVFPKRGSVTAKVSHADEPGVLDQIMKKLESADLNILSAILRRGGAAPQDAVLIAVCEPGSELQPGDPSLAHRIKKAFKNDPMEGRLRVLPVVPKHQPRGSDLRYPRRRNQLQVRIPERQLPLVRKISSEIPAKATPIFISRRFFRDNPQAEVFAKDLRCAVAKNGGHPLEATPDVTQQTPTPDYVAAHLWAAAGGIVLVTNPGDNEADRAAFSLNLAHEIGFLHGQGKPILCIAEDGAMDHVKPLSNWWGVFEEFLPKMASSPESPKSIEAAVKKFMTKVFNVNSQPDSD